MNSKHAVAVLVLITAGAVAVSAQEFGDPQKGQTFARTVCAECHSVDARQRPSPNGDAPPFAMLAKTSGMTAMALRTWLQSSHPTMPNLVLKQEDRDNVIAYILSLNKKGS